MKKEALCYSCKTVCSLNAKRYYLCTRYTPRIENQLNFIDNIIKKWEDKKK